jgi:hypothetical protein
MRTLGVSILLLAAACSGKGSTSQSASALGAPANAVGTPCVFWQETSTSFEGFQAEEVSVEDHGATCGANAVCLANHFRGRVTCPYGQASGASACNASGAPVQVAVQPQCTDRRAADTVYCSCRCANGDGRTDDGASYCACPSDYECAPLVKAIGTDIDGLAGGYCIKRGTEYDRGRSCSASCDPTTQNCP